MKDVTHGVMSRRHDFHAIEISSDVCRLTPSGAMPRLGPTLKITVQWRQVTLSEIKSTALVNYIKIC